MNDVLSVAHVVPGSGGTFYCQNCLRDLALVPALRALGHDAYVLPLYLPLSDDVGTIVKDSTVFYGAVNLYLQETLPLLRKLPHAVKRWLDSPSMLSYAAGKSGRTSATGLEGMTISVLKGEAGNQTEALNELVSWLRQQPTPPNIIHLSNALLLGLAPTLKREFGVPVICSLQDELGWIETMAPAFAAEVWELMQSSVPAVDGFVSVSAYYADAMCRRLDVPDERMTVIPVGIAFDHFYPPQTRPMTPTIGFVSKTSPQYGLDLALDAFIELKKDPAFANLRFKATGGMTSDTMPFLKKTQKRLATLGLVDDVEFVEDFSEQRRGDFLRGLTILTVPVPGGEAFGTYQIEAMACGVPVVQPRAGAFTEVVEDTGGGILYDPEENENLADALRELLRDPARASALGENGRKAVRSRYGVDVTAKRHVELYHSLLEAKP